MSLTDIFGPVISSYTRAQAIADGTLIDITPTAREAGITVPAVLTAAAWAQAVTWSRNDGFQDEDGRLWDVLTMARHAIAHNAGNAERLTFCVLRVPNTARATRPRPMSLAVHIGPGDDGEAVLTIMCTNED